MKTHRRRVSSRDFDDDDGTMPSLVELLLSSVVDPAVKSAVHHVKRGAESVARWTLERLIAVGVVAAVLVGGILLLLVAGVKGLEAARVPVWVAYLSMGVFALAAGFFLFRRVLPPDRDDED